MPPGMDLIVTMRFVLVDLKIAGTKANRDHTGGFGSFMRSSGLIGTAVSRIKSSLIDLPVMSLGFTSTILRDAGHEVIFSYGELTRDADIIIIANAMHCYADELAWAARQRELSPKARIGFYGPFVQEKPELFEQGSDFRIGGELESAIFAYLEGHHDFSGTLNFGIVKDVEKLPFPDWSGMDHKRFSYFPLLHKRPFFPIQASRGCSFNCDFCPYMVSQTKYYRRRDPEHVVAEMERNVRDYGMRSFLFRDICFTLNRKYARRISGLMIERGLKLDWACETRLDCLDESLIDIMVDAGLVGMNIGIETGNNEILEKSGKTNPAVARQEEIIAYLQGKGVRINGFYMLGLIGDTSKTMDETVQYAKRLNTLGAQFCVMTPFPGTPLASQLSDSLLTTDYTQFNEYQPVVEIGTATAQEVRDAHAHAYRKYYLRPSWLLQNGATTAIRMIQNIAS